MGSVSINARGLLSVVSAAICLFCILIILSAYMCHNVLFSVMNNGSETDFNGLQQIVVVVSGMKLEIAWRHTSRPHRTPKIDTAFSAMVLSHVMRGRPRSLLSESLSSIRAVHKRVMAIEAIGLHCSELGLSR